MTHVFSTEEAEFLVRAFQKRVRCSMRAAASQVQFSCLLPPPHPQAEDVHVAIIPRVDYKELRCISVRLVRLVRRGSRASRGLSSLCSHFKLACSSARNHTRPSPAPLPPPLLQGTYGPFKRKQDAVVPLWLAIRLRSDHKADIACPPWLTVEALRAAYAAETSPQNASVLSGLPVFYLEIASLLFKHAADNITDVEQARQLVKDLEEVRAEKLRRGRARVIERARTGSIVTVLNLDNVSFLEAAALSADMLPLLDELGKLERAQTEAEVRRRGMGGGGGPGPAGPGPLSGSGPSGLLSAGATGGSSLAAGTTGSGGGAASAVSAAAAAAAAAVGRRYAGLGLGQLGGSRRAQSAAGAAADAGASSAVADSPADAAGSEEAAGPAVAGQGVSTVSLMAQAAEAAGREGDDQGGEDGSEQQSAE